MAYDINKKKCRYADIPYPCNKLHRSSLHVYNHVLAFTQLATCSASVVKSNFHNLGGGINPSIPLLGTPLVLGLVTIVVVVVVIAWSAGTVTSPGMTTVNSTLPQFSGWDAVFRENLIQPSTCFLDNPQDVSLYRQEAVQQRC